MLVLCNVYCIISITGEFSGSGDRIGIALTMRVFECGIVYVIICKLCMVIYSVLFL